jgi:hypothetical protein
MSAGPRRHRHHRSCCAFAIRFCLTALHLSDRRHALLSCSAKKAARHRTEPSQTAAICSKATVTTTGTPTQHHSICVARRKEPTDAMSQAACAKDA